MDLAGDVTVTVLTGLVWGAWSMLIIVLMVKYYVDSYRLPYTPRNVNIVLGICVGIPVVVGLVKGYLTYTYLRS